MCESGAFGDMKIELIQGELERMPPPLSEHGRLQGAVLGALLQALLGTDIVLFGETGIDLGDDTVVGCDVVAVRSVPASNRVLRADEVVLAVEVAETTLPRDLGMKRSAYARAGIDHYWVVDRQRAVVHVFGEPIDGDYAQVSTTRFDQPLAVPCTDRTIIIDG